MPPTKLRILVSLTTGFLLLSLVLIWTMTSPKGVFNSDHTTTRVTPTSTATDTLPPDGVFVINPDSTLRANIELTDQYGQRRTPDTFIAPYLLVFFGFTFCPDICPAELATIRLTQSRLDTTQRELFQPIFITVDPKRDSSSVLAEYLSHFSPVDSQKDATPDIIGLTGSPTEIQSILKGYKVVAQEVPADVDGGYLINHTGFVYIIDRASGQVKIMLRNGLTVDAMTNALVWFVNQPRDATAVSNS